MSKSGYGSINKEVVDEEVVDEEVVNEEVVDENNFDVVFSPPAIIDDVIVFFATISNCTGVLYQGNMHNKVSISNDNANDVKAIIESIKTNTLAAKARLETNKDWYK